MHLAHALRLKNQFHLVRRVLEAQVGQTRRRFLLHFFRAVSDDRLLGVIELALLLESVLKSDPARLRLLLQ